MGHDQAYQHMYNGRPQEGEKGTERIFEEIMVKIFPILIKNINLHIQGSQ